MRFGSHKGCLELGSCCKSNDLKRYWTCQKPVNRVRYRLRKTGGFSSKMRLGFLIWNGKDARTVVRRKVSVYEHSMFIFLSSNVQLSDFDLQRQETMLMFLSRYLMFREFVRQTLYYYFQIKPIVQLRTILRIFRFNFLIMYVISFALQS